LRWPPVTACNTERKLTGSEIELVEKFELSASGMSDPIKC